MKFLSEGIEYLQKHVSFYFLNMLLLIANVLVGFYTQYYSVMFSSLAAITVSTYLYDADHASINMKSMDMIVIISILFPIAFLWFQQGHPTRVYAGLIILWALLLFIADKVYSIHSGTKPESLFDLMLTPQKLVENKEDTALAIIHYLGSFGHFIFNLEWALLVLL
jgi:hypothetical protein